jgi:hypothetical protein
MGSGALEAEAVAMKVHALEANDAMAIYKAQMRGTLGESQKVQAHHDGDDACHNAWINSLTERRAVPLLRARLAAAPSLRRGQ